jgi:ABC-three component (ABC-3C) system Middle Component 3
MISDGLLNEYELMLNVGLGAEALVAYTAAFERAQGSSGEAITLWHIVTVLPLVFHEVSRRAISKRQSRSGLRSILTRDPNNDIAQNEPIFDFEQRLRAMFPRTMRSLNCAVSWGLLEITDGIFHSTVRRTTPSFTGEAKQIVEAAKKLGGWAGGLTAFEYFTVLGIGFNR